MDQTYGHFSRDGQEYHLLRHVTPRYWHQFLHNDQYGVTISQTGHGYSWYKTMRSYRVTLSTDTNYSPTSPNTGRFLYLHDEESGQAWHVNPQHFERQDADFSDWRCIYGLTHVTIGSVRHQIEHETTFFVPPDDPVEIWRVRLRNRSSRPRRLSLFSYLQWHLSSYPKTWTDPQVYISPAWLPGEQAILVFNHNPESLLQYGGFLTSDRRPVGFDTSMKQFLGSFARPDAAPLPQAVLHGRCSSRHVFAEPYIAATHHTLVLPPKGQVSIHYLVGVALKRADVARLKRKYLGGRRPDQAFQAAMVSRRRLNDSALVQTPDPDFDRFFNYWLKNQLLIVRNWTRADMKGYRDILQDLRGSMSFDPAWARQWLLKTLSYQYRDGTAPRQWDPIGQEHDLRNYMDSPSWIPDALTSYVKESGDLAILHEVLPYFDGGQATVYEHALQAARCLYQKRGAHGICLMGHGDWNDALNEIGRRGKGESVWLATAMCYACLLMEALARRIGDSAAAAEMRNYYESIKRQINAGAWDGQWYVYAFSDDGTPVGSRRSRQGKIHLNVQTWAIFTGVAEGPRLKTLLRQIDRCDTELGPILLHPCYKAYDRRIGRITGMIPSAFENGAIYTHGAAFKMRADCAIGRADKALETFRKVLPINPHNPPDRSTLEPFGLSNFHCGPENKPNFGKALYSFLSGSGNWLYTTALEHLLGIESDYDGLRIHPLLPRKWQGFHVHRNFRGATYEIQVRRRPGSKPMRITCDGKTLQGNLVPAFADGKTHRVNVAVPTGR